jgi:hypothetical protein
MKRCIGLLLFGLALAIEAEAQPVVDGRAAGSDGYGTALSVQNTNTQFGNANVGDPINGGQMAGGGGSEIDQVFGVVANGRLYVTITGNLEHNFNKMEVFIDSVAGGVNTIDGGALPTMVDGYFSTVGNGVNLPNPTDGALQRMTGLTFDAGFDADYFLTFTHGFETVNPNLPDTRSFWAISAHYADLTQGTSGEVVAAGMQLAYGGQPNVLRFPGDYNDDRKINAADYVIWRATEGQNVARGSGADASGNETVDEADYNIWRARFNDGTALGDFPFTPGNLSLGVSEALLGPALPGLSQGELIDRNYALGAGGCVDDTGASCVAGELEFALDIDPNETGTNQSNHRSLNNSIGLELGFNNSNAVGVTGDGPYATPTTGNPQDVLTGIEFSIPLSEIGNPAGPIRLTAFVNNSNHDFSSNQYAGEGILFDNVGNLMPDLELEFSGAQFVTVANPGAGGGAGAVSAPEPGTLMLFVIAGLAACGFARRR